ncbi:LrgB family protein [Sinanaerobacter sp. ZZT-01]|uniref:LrgB family protein n=1 Tax=Sinanaerobacter sp. ZZT-01 TaxID=3111540 RepID=UPI002D795C21|nr:LrgB family protein [Sinanaerobacter sp. ZZT-01]WRR92116.1 LrgB family protein [Sinanaerobacter sp. ZZT-01]
MRELLLSNPYWAILLTLVAYLAGIWIQRKTCCTLLQPILVCSVLLIAFLMITGISFEEYNEKSQFLNFILPLTAVVLAVPLYRNLVILKKYAIPIFSGIFAGTLATILSLVAIGKIMGTKEIILISMLPKSATNPIAIEVSSQIGGIPSLTVAMVVIAGCFGAICGPEILKLMGITHPVAKGIAIGTLSHAVGTSRAFKEGQIEGSMSSLAIALAGMATAICAPIAAVIFF